MENYNHQVGLKIVGEMLPQERNRVTLADETTSTACRPARHLFLGRQRQAADRPRAQIHDRGARAIDATEIWAQDDDTCHLNGTARMGDDPRTQRGECRLPSWDIRNLWICDGSVFPTVGGVNPSLTIQAIACRTADRIKAMAARGEL